MTSEEVFDALCIVYSIMVYANALLPPPGWDFLGGLRNVSVWDVIVLFVCVLCCCLNHRSSCVCTSVFVVYVSVSQSLSAPEPPFHNC